MPPKRQAKSRKTRPLTSTALAKELGISQATVSLALNDNPLVNARTKERVKAAARRLHYRPNRIAAAMRTGRTSTIGMVIPNARFSFYPDIIDAIERGAKQKDAQCLFCQSHGSMEGLEKEIEMLLDHQVDGILLTPRDGFERRPIYQRLLKMGMPTVFCDYETTVRTASTVASHNVEIGRQIARHLVALGHRRIVFLQGNRGIRNFRRRYEGFRQFLEEAGVPHPEELVCGFDDPHGSTDEVLDPGPDGVVSAYDGERRLFVAETIYKLLDDRVAFTAVAAAGDLLAIPAMKALQSRGVKIPGDVSVVGCANLDITALLSPGLTTVDQNASKIGEQAIRLLLEKIANPSLSHQKVLVEPTLIVRQSTAPCGKRIG